MGADIKQKTRCAVREASRPEEQPFIEEYLSRERAMSVVRFLPKDDDELNTELCAGRFQRVVFATLDDLLTTVWKGQGSIDRWEAAGVEIELARPASMDAGWRDFARAVQEGFGRWQGEQRRKQIVAAVILSLLALATMAVLFMFVPPAK